MEQQNEFMLIFRFAPSTEQPTEEQLNEMHQTWGAYFGGLAAEGKFVSTHQLGFEGMQIAADRSISEGFTVSENMMLGGNLVVKVDTMEEAVAIGKECPILHMGGTVEVRSIQPM